MERIDKVTFENIRDLSISKSFEELDVNGDGVITSDDKAVSQNDEISNQIQYILNLQDADPVLDENATQKAAADDDDTRDYSYLELKELIGNVKKEITELSNQISELETENETLQREKEALETEQSEKAEELQAANRKLEEEEKLLNAHIVEYTAVQQEAEDVNEQILIEQNREQEEYEHDLKVLTNRAIEAYNPETDGSDFNAYFARKMDSYSFPVFTKLSSLNNQAMTLSSHADRLLEKISNQSAIVYSARDAANIASAAVADVNSRLEAKVNLINSNLTKIQELQTDVNTKKTRMEKLNKKMQALIPGGGLTAAELLAQIPDYEKNYAKELGWNAEDCLFAMGDDGKFHIYYNSFSGYGGVPGWGISSVRMYNQEKNGNYYTADSLQKIAMGSGWMSQPTDLSETGGGRAIYTFSSINDDWTDGEADCYPGGYQTCSPLSFDVDGNGIKTDAKMVQFDLDGDGKLDNINNSAEWVLAFDKDHNGKAGENGSELFGNYTDLDGDGKADGYKDGFEALKALAKKEGLISDNDMTLDENDLKLLEKKYGLVMTKGYNGEAKSLSDLGITQINLASTNETKLESNFDGRNNDIMRQEGATFVVNGQTREYADIWNAMKNSYDADKEIVASRLNPEMETFEAASTVVKEENILHINSEKVLALKGKVDIDKLKADAKLNAESEKELFEKIIKVEDEE